MSEPTKYTDNKTNFPKWINPEWEVWAVLRITELEAWQEKAFEAHPNIDLDIAALEKKPC
jgi:hypothetical protein